jgi:hypothetical protein
VGLGLIVLGLRLRLRNGHSEVVRQKGHRKFGGLANNEPEVSVQALKQKFTHRQQRGTALGKQGKIATACEKKSLLLPYR